MSVLLALPTSIAMRSPPTSSYADFKGSKLRAGRSTSLHPSARSPHLLHRALGGRIGRPRSTSSAPLSLRNQQVIWETVTGQTWDVEQGRPATEDVQDIQSLQYITPQSLTISPSLSAASTAALDFDAVSAVATPTTPAGIVGCDPSEHRELLK